MLVKDCLRVCEGLRGLRGQALKNVSHVNAVVRATILERQVHFLVAQLKTDLPFLNHLAHSRVHMRSASPLQGCRFSTSPCARPSFH